MPEVREGGLAREWLAYELAPVGADLRTQHHGNGDNHDNDANRPHKLGRIDTILASEEVR